MTSIESALVDPTIASQYRLPSAPLSMIGLRRGIKRAPATAAGGLLPMINNSISTRIDAARMPRSGADMHAPVADTTDRVFAESLDSPPPGAGG